MTKEMDSHSQNFRVTALNEVVSSISHEISSPLALIHSQSSYLKLLAKRGNIDPQVVTDYAEKTMATVQRISKIVQGLCDFTDEGATAPLESVEVETLVFQALEFCRHRTENLQIRMEIDLPSQPLHLNCRSVQISQILINLIANAADAVSSVRDRWIQVQVQGIGSMVHFSVTDSGVGIPKNVEEKIFQPFFTTKPFGQGTGLGLSISTAVAQKHRGQLYLDRTSQFTRFVLELPRRQSAFGTGVSQ